MTTTFLSATGQPGHKRLRLIQPEFPAPHPFLEWLVRPVGVEGATGWRYGWPVTPDALHYVVVVAREA